MTVGLDVFETYNLDVLGTWSLPAVTLSGTFNVNEQNISNAKNIYNSPGSNLQLLTTSGGVGSLTFTTRKADTTTLDTRLAISGSADIATATWTDITHTGIVLGGALTINGQIFDAGAVSAQINTTGVSKGLTIQNTSEGAGGADVTLYHISTTPAVNDQIGRLKFAGQNAGSPQGAETYGTIRCDLADITVGAEASKFVWTPMSSGSGNIAMELSGAGTLWVDENITLDDNYVSVTEMTAPGAGAANTARIYAVVGGDTLTDLAAVFQDGTVDVFAQETTPLDAPQFTNSDKTKVTIELRKPHPGLIQYGFVFPDGGFQVFKEIQYHDAEKIAANTDCEGDLPAEWFVETAAERKERVDRETATTESVEQLPHYKIPTPPMVQPKPVSRKVVGGQ